MKRSALRLVRYSSTGVTPSLGASGPAAPSSPLQALRSLFRGFYEPYSSHRSILRLGSAAPSVSAESYIAESALVAGHVQIADRVSVWPDAIVRSEPSSTASSSSSSPSNSSAASSTSAAVDGASVLHVGYGSNVQDGAIVTGATVIGSFVTIGHGAQLHSTKVGDESLIGMGAVLMPGSVVEPRSIVAAGAVVGAGVVVKEGEVWGGVPARRLRATKETEQEYFMKSAEEYWKLAIKHRENTDAGEASLWKQAQTIRKELGIQDL
ncbi:mitochondrial Complex I (CI) NADH:ubiquinone oxidoreductase subunit gamma carbonic anhydrase 1 [Andalucia godoyi]|uniref:Mitochondrial Complex I (CI) NADH:ubiquinone oxidoreductase subunit gamma carbonic anhydrase 1 n=1 Tax=Andalucia godoyi TaxID=505711 RepID=A0A8K0AHZ5_ANDGO|nr:mitochondrial Complex I (CI) NADH:ubiquinone oxidoreductase subunit gamma carbonic anhydrase 1 [Andalucia godoyi]|eukprot:ANDGO_05623.mRNA.1 mitochondrial Complex I (CI) NADH:ubiquinone oxidoreductase subunit gamma carbonic anhydrase 1 (gamma CA1 Type II)